VRFSLGFSHRAGRDAGQHERGRPRAPELQHRAGPLARLGGHRHAEPARRERTHGPGAPDRHVAVDPNRRGHRSFSSDVNLRICASGVPIPIGRLPTTCVSCVFPCPCPPRTRRRTLTRSQGLAAPLLRLVLERERRGGAGAAAKGERARKSVRVRADYRRRARGGSRLRAQREQLDLLCAGTHPFCQSRG
jgi:hypothetical protein